MGRLRIYPSKQNTIASGIYQSYNSSQNAIADLWYGGGVQSDLNLRNSISRHLVYFDLSDLASKIANTEVNTALTVTYKLRMKNAVPSDKTLDKEFEFDQIQKDIASSFDLVVFPINKFWDEGRGYDFFKQRYTYVFQGGSVLSGYSNWNSATSIVDWDEPGIFSDPTASTTNYVTQHFSIGSEDLSVDVTDIVNDWLSGGSENYGFGIAYTRPYELTSANTRYISSFFTNKTNFHNKPFIEVIFDEQKFIDDRNQVTNNRASKLYLYTYSGNSLANYYSASTVNIYRESDDSLVHSGLTPTQVEKGVYYVEVFMSGATRGERYRDVWGGITFAPGYDQQDITQYFTIRDNYYTTNRPSINEYAINIYGIDDGATISNDELIRVYCDLRVNYSLNNVPTNYKLYYRVILNDQDEVVPWSMVNQTYEKNCISNYFLLDTSWLLHNQTYRIDFKIEELGTSRTLPQNVVFRVLRPF